MSGEVTLFNYQGLDAKTRSVVEREDEEFDRNVGEAGASFVRACHNLKRIHEALKYERPGFQEWLVSKPGLSNGTAHRMLDVAQMFPDSGNIFPQSREALYLLASPSTPEPARQEILQRSTNGEQITHAKAKEIVESHKEIAASRSQAQVDTPDEDEEADTPQRLERRERSQPAPKPLPKHPYSDQLTRWIRFVSGETHVINIEQGGIKALLADKRKWDRREVKEFILPMLEALGKTIGEFHREIEDAFAK